MSNTTDPRKAFEQKMVELGHKNDMILGASCDSASGGGLGSFFKEFPERCVETGISEQNAVSLCAAMSREGYIPVLVVITPFLAMRAYEQIRDDVGYVESNVKLVGSGGGLAYSTLGSTHATIEDVAVMRTVPHLTILCPGDADEVEFAIEQAVAIKGPVYIRMPRQARPLPLAKTLRF
jgi:transketolase